MRFYVLLITVVLIRLSVVICRPATKCDIDGINQQIQTIGNKVNELKNYLKWIKEEQTSLLGNIAYVNRTVHEHATKQMKSAKHSHTSLKQSIDRRINSYFRKQKRSADGMMDKQFRNYSSYMYKDVKSSRDSNWNMLKHDIKGSIIKINRAYSKLQRPLGRRLQTFNNEVMQMKSKTTSEIERVSDDLYLVSRQVQMQQFNQFEKTRSNGNTGVKQIQTNHVGGKNYHSSDHNGWSVANIRDEESTVRNVGIGPLVAVINGIDFRTSEKHYQLLKPVTNEKEYSKTEPINFPTVPNAVVQMVDYNAQIDEMRAWFKSFQDGSDQSRDYTKHFVSVLSYLESVWTNQAQDEQQFDKDEHYVPSTFMGFNSNQKPKQSAWNYRYLCHQASSFIEPMKFKPLYDPVSQRRHDWQRIVNTAAQKFDLEGLDVNGNRRKPGDERAMYYTYLDALMEEVPGLDNYGAKITATGFDAKIKSAHPLRPGQDLNGAYYHRPYKLTSTDAMGVDTAQRGYSDRLYVALTTQEQVSGPTINITEGMRTKSVTIKASYALPMEIIYLTPLHEWNPFNIPFEEDCDNVDGKGTQDDPYTANCPSLNYHTPEAFFMNTDPLQCSDNNPDDAFYFQSDDFEDPVCMMASGVRIYLPPIDGIEGRIRTRYPIMPVHGEGSSIWKKLNAIEDAINLSGTIKVEKISFKTGESTNIRLPTHQHQIVLTLGEINALQTGKITTIKKITEPDSFHQHIVTITYNRSKQSFTISACDSGQENDVVCFDGHRNVLNEIA